MEFASVYDNTSTMCRVEWSQGLQVHMLITKPRTAFTKWSPVFAAMLLINICI